MEHIVPDASQLGRADTVIDKLNMDKDKRRAHGKNARLSAWLLMVVLAR